MTSTTRSELILYATPTDDLAATCRRYFDEIGWARATVAQRYPPHCTLTGFFRREHHRVHEVAAEVADVVERRGPVPPGAVTITGLSTGDDWVGLELSSPWLRALTADFENHHELMPGDDPLRAKDWLHLSLAYGCDDLDPHRELAEKLFASIPPGGWEVALWQLRADGSWLRFDA